MRKKTPSRFLFPLSLLGLGTLLVGFTSNPSAFSRATAAIAPANTNPFTHLKNWGLFHLNTKSHIQAPDAWKLTQGSRDIVVAVIDTGVDANHKDLAPNIWQDKNFQPTLPALAPYKGKKIYGWDYVAGKPNPQDNHGHGTHVAGIIGAVTNTEAGISGVAHKVSIMAVKYYAEGNTGPVNLRNTVKAIEYAVEHGARIINYSGGGPEFSEPEYLAIKKAQAKGVLFVAAAGNDRHNTDLVENYYYPSAYRLDNIISVAAINIESKLLASSNWGKKKVDVAAPGENIYSTLPGNKYGYMSGTSQATAFVTGLAALILAKNPNLKPQEVKEIIRNSVDVLPSLKGKIASEGKVNAYKALLALSNGGKLPPKTQGLVVLKQPLSLLDLNPLVN